MPRVHFLNVGHGDCSIIQHGTGRVSVIDVSNGNDDDAIGRMLEEVLGKTFAGGNFAQGKRPVNPIAYMQARGITDVHRFINTHPDMDHLDGIEALFKTFPPLNVWDTDNTCVKSGFGNSRYQESDWKFYHALRDGTQPNSLTRLVLYAGDRGSDWNVERTQGAGHDGLHILAPTPALMRAANACSDWNDSSYVLLYRAENSRILFAGDSHDATWEHILANYAADVRDVDVLIAPHHGRHSDRSWDFLDVVNPALTLFGVAPSEHLAYDAWSRRGLPIITNTQAGSIVLNVTEAAIHVYVSHEPFARSRDPETFYHHEIGGWYLQHVQRVSPWALQMAKLLSS